MRKSIYLFVIAIMLLSVGIVSCADKQNNNLQQTGLIDQNGNLITNTLIETNTVYIRGNIPEWATNLRVDYVIITNSNYTEIRYPDGTLVPNLPDNPTALYKIRVPYAGTGDGIYTVDFRDTERLKQLWLDQIKRKGMNDGKVFAIRNKANNRNPYNFQNRHSSKGYSAQDYYYFNENGDIVWKEDNTIIKKFMGAIITDYRDIEKREFGKGANGSAIVKYTWKQKGVYTVGGIYAMTMSTEDARWKYLNRKRGENRFKKGDDPFKDGVFDFIAARYAVETFNNGFVHANNLFERVYFPGFIEVLVVYTYDNMGYGDTSAGVHSYYPYYGVFDVNTPYQGSEGFTEYNIPYMTNHNIYLAQRPEYTIPQLTHSAAFTDNPRGWCYLFMPGYPN